MSMLEKLVERGKTMAVLFYDPNDDEDHLIMDELEKIDDDCRRYLLTYLLALTSLGTYVKVIAYLRAIR